MPRSVAASVCLGILPVALSGLLGSCVTMKPVKPARELRPVAIGDGKGSARTTVDAGLSPLRSAQSRSRRSAPQPRARRERIAYAASPTADSVVTASPMRKLLGA